MKKAAKILWIIVGIVFLFAILVISLADKNTKAEETQEETVFPTKEWKVMTYEEKDDFLNKAIKAKTFSNATEVERGVREAIKKEIRNPKTTDFEWSPSIYNGSAPLGSADGNSIRKNKEIAKLKDFTVSLATTTANGVEISASGLNNMRQLLFDVDTYIERIGMTVVFKPTSSTKVNIWAGKGEMGIKIDAINNKIYIQRLNGSLSGTEVHESFDLDFEILQGIKYTIGFVKLDEKYVKLFVYGANGYFEKTFDKYASANERRVAIAWGKPFFGVNNGDVLVSSAMVHSDYDFDSEVIIAGDSFIEGTSLIGNGDSLDDRWCALIANDIGKMRTVISGKGGEAINSAFITRFKRELSWFGNLKYAIISLGTNNSNFASYKTAMETLISYLESIGITPILVTITPRPGFDYNSVTKTMSDWVKSTGYLYIDMQLSVTNINDGSIWKPGFVMTDNVHPTVLGHRYQIYVQSKWN